MNIKVIFRGCEVDLWVCRFASPLFHTYNVSMSYIPQVSAGKIITINTYFVFMSIH